MKKKYRGLAQPMLVVLLLILFMIINTIVVVAKATYTVPGSEVAPPGGSTVITPINPPEEPGEEPQAPVSPGETQQPPVTTEPVLPPETPTVTEPSATEPPTITTESQLPQMPEIPGTVVETVETVGTYPAQLDTSGVTIFSPTMDELLTTGANLEALLYPSGIQLPTKYMDLLMLAPTSSSAPITGETAYFLKTVAPVSNNTYTYAEYKAAEMYLALCRLYMQEDGLSNAASAAKSLDDNTSVNWMYNVTNATLTSTDRLVALLVNYRDILEQAATGADISGHSQYSDFVGDHRGVKYSYGNLSALIGVSGGYLAQDKNIAAYLLGLYSWWDYIGVTQTLTSSITEFSPHYNEFSYNGVNFSRGAPVNTYASSGGTTTQQPSQPVIPGGTTEVFGPSDSQGTQQQPGQPGIITGSSGTTSSSGSNWTQSGTSTPSDGPVMSVGGSTDTSVLPEGNRNIKDVASIGAAIFVVIAVVALWAIRSYRKGQDPMFKKWK